MKNRKSKILVTLLLVVVMLLAIGCTNDLNQNLPDNSGVQELPSGGASDGTGDTTTNPDDQGTTDGTVNEQETPTEAYPVTDDGGGESTVDGGGEGAADGGGEGTADGGEGTADGSEGTVDGSGEGTVDGGGEGAADDGGEGTADGGEGAVDGSGEGTADGSGEGTVDGGGEGTADGGGEGAADGSGEGAADGGGEGTTDGGSEGAADGSGDGGNVITHVIQAGETVGTIAQRYGVSIQDIVVANNLVNENSITAGDTLQIVAGAGDSAEEVAPQFDPNNYFIHVVSYGETLGIIAQRYGFTIQELAEYNAITNVNRVDLFQEIKIPVR